MIRGMPSWKSPLCMAPGNAPLEVLMSWCFAAATSRTSMNAYRNLTVALGFVLASVGNVTAGADMGPVIVVPGRPGVPVMVNGRDVSGAVIEGDWGLGHSPAGITIMQPRSWADP